MTIRGTLCFIVKDSDVLLLKKSEGLFGQGKWNAPGGKLQPNEDSCQCVAREVLEETGLKVTDLEHVGVVHFYKEEKRHNPDWLVDVFLSRRFEGTPKSGREGIVRWFNLHHLPFEDMWEDDPHWSKLALNGKKFEGWFYYSGDFEKLVDCRIDEKSHPSSRA